MKLYPTDFYNIDKFMEGAKIIWDNLATSKKPYNQIINQLNDIKKINDEAFSQKQNTNAIIKASQN